MTATLWLPLAAGAAGTPAVMHYGPIASTSPDSGTCGNDWATDTFDRVFKANTSPNDDGTYSVVQQFKKGSFVTIAGLSPGACETNLGGTIAGGVTGTFQGSFNIVVTGGTFNPAADCSTGCNTTAGFIATVYGAGATYDVPTFAFNYASSDQSLSERTWRNASADRGGNRGDIAN